MATTTAELSQEEKRSLIAIDCGKLWHSESQHVGIQKAATLHGRGIKGMQMAWEQCECGASRYNGSKNWEFTSSKREEAPDYFHDLNAIAEAVSILNKLQKIYFCYFLCNPDGTMEYIASMGDNEWIENPCSGWFAIFNATAQERAEAFGKALNLW